MSICQEKRVFSSCFFSRQFNLTKKCKECKFTEFNGLWKLKIHYKKAKIFINTKDEYRTSRNVDFWQNGGFKKIFATHKAIIFHHHNVRLHVAGRVKNYFQTAAGKFSLTRLTGQTKHLLTTICSGCCRTPHWNTVHIRKVYQKLAWLILGQQAGLAILGWSPQIERKMGKCYSFSCAILWIKLLYIFILNKRWNWIQL